MEPACDADVDVVPVPGGEADATASPLIWEVLGLQRGLKKPWKTKESMSAWKKSPYFQEEVDR